MPRIKFVAGDPVEDERNRLAPLIDVSKFQSVAVDTGEIVSHSSAEEMEEFFKSGETIPVGAEIRTRIMTVTPEIARRWLKRNIGNRHMRPESVESYRRDAEDGNWLLNGETLVFDVAGVVANGQHRMMGLAEARPGTKVQILVVTGVTQTKIYDVPVRRTATDILKLSNTNAAICRALAMLESGDIVFAYSKKFSISEVEEVWKRANETIQLFPRTAALPISAPMLAAFAYAYPIEPEAVQRLFEKIRDGEGLRKNDPAYTFRNWLVKNPLASRASLDERAYAMLNVISAELRGDTISSIHRTPMGYFYTNQKRRALNVEPTPSYKHDDETKKKLIARDARARQKVEAMTPKAVDDLLLLDFEGEE